MRLDIFHVWQVYEMGTREYEQTFTLAEIEALRSHLKQLCSDLHAAVIADETSDKFNALCWYLGDGRRDALNTAAEAAHEALVQLSLEPNPGAIVEDIRSPYTKPLREALELMRRPVSVGGPRRAETWGISPGRRNKAFRSFLSVFCHREISENELQNRLAELSMSKEELE
ncbi:MAG: hypothetical protein AAF674_15610 [Pseudomonadota bacterium]